MSRRQPFLACALLLSGGALLSGCFTETGDLGRPRPSIWNEEIFPRAGFVSAYARGEPVAFRFHFTDAETELRNRAWRYVMPAHERSYFDRQLQELAYTRILPTSLQSENIATYFESLRSGTLRSPASRYRRLGEDAFADRALMANFRGTARRVIAADQVRLTTGRASQLVPGGSLSEAEARVAENVGLIAWVCERTRYRLASYRYALDNLVVEMPQEDAIAAERAIAALEAEGAACDGLDFGAATSLKPKPISVRG